MSNYEHVPYLEKITKCDVIMEVGKKLFRDQKYHQALEKYEIAFKFLLPSLMDENEEVEKLKTHEMKVLSNICACQMKLENFRVVVEICKKIQENKNLMDENLKLKMYYRIGVANFELNYYSDAVESFVLAQDLNSNSKTIENFLSRAIEANDRHIEREKKHLGENLLNVIGSEQD